MTRFAWIAGLAAALLTVAGSAAATPATEPPTQVYSLAFDGSGERSLSGSAESAHTPAQARDGRIAYVRFAHPSSELWTMSADGGGQRRLAGIAASELRAPPAWSPTGTEIAVGDLDYSPCLPTSRNCAVAEVRILDAATGAVRARISSKGRGAGLFSWAPDGRRLAVLGTMDSRLSAAATLELVSRNGTGRRVLARANGLGFADVAWSPRGDRIAYVRSGWIWTIKPGGGKPTRVVRGDLPRWSPRGDRLLYRAAGALRLADPEGSRQQLLVHEPKAFMPAWSPDGRRVAFRAGEGGTSTPLVVVRASDGRRVFMATVPGSVSSLAFAPDGKRLVYSSWRTG